MINKISASVADAPADVRDGATVMVGGFGTAGIPNELIDGLIAQGARDLTIVNNNAGNGETGLAALLKTGRVRKIVCSFPRQADSQVFNALYRARKLELELLPQGNLVSHLTIKPAFPSESKCYSPRSETIVGTRMPMPLSNDPLATARRSEPLSYIHYSITDRAQLTTVGSIFIVKGALSSKAPKDRSTFCRVLCLPPFFVVGASSCVYFFHQNGSSSQH